jgi:alpha-glucosidase
MMFTPLSFEYFGEEALQAEDQLLLGEELMIAPVVKSNARGRYVYLPEDMALVSFREDEVRLSAAKAGVTYLPYGLSDLKFFLRRNKVMPYIAPGRSVKDLSMKVIQLIGYVETEAFYTLYDDDGTSYGYEDGMVYKTEFSARRDEDGDIKVSVRNENPNIEKVIFTLMDGDENCITKEVQV